jgi:hypothetical protein
VLCARPNRLICFVSVWFSSRFLLLNTPALWQVYINIIYPGRDVSVTGRAVLGMSFWIHSR